MGADLRLAADRGKLGKGACAILLVCLLFCVFGSADAQLHVEPSHLLMRNSDGNPTLIAKVGVETTFWSWISHSGAGVKEAIAIIEIRDGSNITQSLEWRPVSFGEGGAEVSSNWIPESEGDFSSRVLVISDFESPKVLSPVVTTNAAAARFDMQLGEVTGLEEMAHEDLERLGILLARQYLAILEPFWVLSYESVAVDVQRVGMQFHNGRDSYLLHTNATAKVASADANEAYVLRAGYNEIDEIFEAQSQHHNKHLPAALAAAALDRARNDSMVHEFYAQFENATGQRIVSGATYLDSNQIRELKFIDSDGKLVIRPGFEFLPDSGQVLTVSFTLTPIALIEDPEEGGSFERPNVDVYLDPSSYRIIGAQKLFWE